MTIRIYDDYFFEGKLYIHSLGNSKHRIDKWLKILKLIDTKVYDKIQFMNLMNSDITFKYKAIKC